MTDFSELLVADRGQKAHAVHLVDKAGFEAWLKKRPAEDRHLVEAQRFTGKSGFVVLPRGGDFEVVGAVDDAKKLDPWALGALSAKLPAGTYKLAEGAPGAGLWLSRDNGATFTEVGKNIPGLPNGALDGDNPYWIARIDASHFDAGTAYVSVDGHRSDDIKPYLFVTRDYGKTWQSIVNNLPAWGNIQVVREDPKNKDLLYVGTEFGLYISLDGGKQWQRFMNNLPTSRVDDILVHPRDNDLIIATHGRSIWIADDITPLQQIATTATQDAVLFDIRPAIAYLQDRQRGQQTGGQKAFVGENPPRGATISYYLKSAASGDVKITIADATGRTIRTIDGTKEQGINRVNWNLAPQPPPGRGQGGGFGGGRGGVQTVDAGTYIVTLSVNGKTMTKPVSVLQDVWLNER